MIDKSKSETDTYSLVHSEFVINVSNHITGMLAYWDKDLICRYANNAYMDWFEKSSEEMIDKITLQELLGPLYESNLPYINNVLSGIPQTFERDITTPSGEVRHALANYLPDIINGKVNGFFVHVANITPIKALQKKLEILNKELEEKVNEKSLEITKLFDRITDGFIALDKDFNFTSVTKKSAKALQREVSDIIGSNLLTDYPQIKELDIYSALTKALSTQQYVYNETYYPPYLRWYEHHIYPSPEGLSIFFRDVTERKRALERIKKSDERYNLAIKATKDGIWDWDIIKDTLYLSPRWCEIIGYDENDTELEHSYQEWERRIHPDHKQAVNDILHAHLNNLSPYEIEYLHLHKSGLYRWQLSVGQAIFDENQKPVRMVGAIMDIHDRKNAAEQLQKSEANLRSIFDHSDIGLVLLNKQLEVLSFNPVANQWALETFGATLQENICLRTLIPEGDRRDTFEMMAQKTFTGNKTEYESSVKDINGNLRYLYVNMCAIKSNDGNVLGLSLSSADITKRKIAEEELKTANDELHTLSVHLLKIKEEERIRISREIHDELGQQLTFLKMETNWLNKTIEPENKIIHTKLQRMEKILNESIRSVRRIATELRPSVLDNLGLLEAIEGDSDKFTATTGILVLFDTNIQQLNLTPRETTAIFRVYQECLTNISKHANAGVVKISLDFNNSNLILAISDDGRGFNLEETNSKNTLGILGMKERITEVGGSVQLTSNIGMGTTIIFIVPCSDSLVQLKT